jgi:hypothetical protein
MAYKVYQDEERRILKAYSDCNDIAAGEERQLNFFCPYAFNLAEAKTILHKALPEGYNRFEAETAIAELDAAFGKDAKVFIAREGSVCIYVKPANVVWIGSGRPADLTKVLNADEVSFQPELGMFRIWWD